MGYSYENGQKSTFYEVIRDGVDMFDKDWDVTVKAARW
jgi:hypothetical protein